MNHSLLAERMDTVRPSNGLDSGQNSIRMKDLNEEKATNGLKIDLNTPQRDTSSESLEKLVKVCTKVYVSFRSGQNSTGARTF